MLVTSWFWWTKWWQFLKIGDRISTLLTSLIGWCLDACSWPKWRHQNLKLVTNIFSLKIRHLHRSGHKQDEHPSWDPKWFGFINVAYLAIPISNGLNSTHSWYRIADSFGFTTTAVNIGIGCLKSVKRFWNSDNLIGGSWPAFPSDIFRKSGQNFEPDLIETIFGYRPLIPA